MPSDRSQRETPPAAPDVSSADAGPAIDPTENPGDFEAPRPGSSKMPPWNTGELVKAPIFTWRHWFALLGPGLLLGGSSIGGGEWLMGPAVTAKYGGALMWLATLSIVAQVIYNMEVSRYTLYTGEPIFTGKFRTAPGPAFWVVLYLILDFGAVFPYLAANAATPLASVLLGGVLPDPEQNESHRLLLRFLGYAIFLLALVPLVAGGKIYNALKAIMTFKMFAVLGFLMILGIFHSSPSTWFEIFGGFLQFGTMPTGGNETANIFTSLAQGKGLPDIDLSTIALLAAFAAIAGSGGLSNAAVSNYTREQGWGMGRHVGAIPSVIGGRELKLSHSGTVFQVTSESLRRWKEWYRHLIRDQVVVWMPACFLGVALPSMLSVQFLARGTEASSWVAAGMTSAGVRTHVGAAWGADAGQLFWYLTMLCGFLVLGPTMSTHSDGFIRRWVDVFWTASPRLQKLDPSNIRWVYFAVVVGLCHFRHDHAFGGSPSGIAEVRRQPVQLRLGLQLFPHPVRQYHPVAPRPAAGVVHAHRHGGLRPLLLAARPDHHPATGRGLVGNVVALPETKPVSLSYDPPRRGGRGPDLPETNACAWWLETGS